MIGQRFGRRGWGRWGLPLLVLCAGGPAQAAGFRVVAYDLQLEIAREHQSVAGHEIIQLRTAGRLEAVSFPRNGLEVLSAKSERGEALRTRLDGDQIEIQLPARVAGGREIAIVVDYRAKQPKGMVFHPDAVYTIFHTCHWMLCRESPGEKATWTLDLAVPEGLTLVASGAPLERARARAAGHQVWKETAPSSSYLFGFALGKFSRTARTHHGVTLEYFAAGADDAWRARVFADDDRMLDFFVARAGRPLPRSFYRQVVVDGDAAQELSSFSILGRAELEHRLADPTEDWLVAHELAHQFWGNLVTCADWPDFWLNEGLTVFMVAAYKEERWGRAAYERELGLWRTRHQAAIDATFDKPLTFAGEYPSLRIKRAIVYSKAALFLAQLREEMGDRAFWSALLKYTRRFAGRAVTSRDFQQVFAAEARRDLSALFDAWVWGAAAIEDR